LKVTYLYLGTNIHALLFSSLRPNRLWGPSRPLYSEYRGTSAGSKAAGAWSWPLTSI